MPRYGDGSVYQRKDGRWVAQLRVDGKQVTRYATTKREALANPEHPKGPSDRTLRQRLKEVLVPRGYVEIEKEGQGGKHRYSWTGKRWGGRGITLSSPAALSVGLAGGKSAFPRGFWGQRSARPVNN